MGRVVGTKSHESPVSREIPGSSGRVARRRPDAGRDRAERGTVHHRCRGHPPHATARRPDKRRSVPDGAATTEHPGANPLPPMDGAGSNGNRAPASLVPAARSGRDARRVRGRFDSRGGAVGGVAPPGVDPRHRGVPRRRGGRVGRCRRRVRHRQSRFWARRGRMSRRRRRNPRNGFHRGVGTGGYGRDGIRLGT